MISGQSGNGFPGHLFGASNDLKINYRMGRTEVDIGRLDRWLYQVINHYFISLKMNLAFFVLEGSSSLYLDWTNWEFSFGNYTFDSFDFRLVIVPHTYLLIDNYYFWCFCLPTYLIVLPIHWFDQVDWKCGLWTIIIVVDIWINLIYP